MKDNENKKTIVRITEKNPSEKTKGSDGSIRSKVLRQKKLLIFALMGIAFLGFMYLIFKPTSSDKEIENIGLNDAVPQATDAGMPDDKSKAYEQEMLEENLKEKREVLNSLSNYWEEESSGVKQSDQTESNDESDLSNTAEKKSDPALTSYRNMKNTLGNFYTDNNENELLNKEIQTLKNQLAQKESSPNPMENQLALMEKSYEMAAKYFPGNAKANDSTNGRRASSEKETFEAVVPKKKEVVSALYREPSDGEFLESWQQERNRSFNNAGPISQVPQQKNSIRACIHETQTITPESIVRLRLIEDARTQNLIISKGTLLTAIAKFQETRLQLLVVSIEKDGSIIPVNLTIYDLDGQKGLAIPYSPENTALTGIAANMSNSTGTSFMMTRSAGQQIAADMSKGAIQGISGYFSKKVKTPKVTLKAGYQVFLVSKK